MFLQIVMITLRRKNNMASIHIGSDNITTYSADKKRLATFCDIVKKAGHDVVNAGVGDNAIQGHMKRHTADIMVQIAGGQCPGTFSDFEWGTAKAGEWGRTGDGYYHARKYCFPMYTAAWSDYNKWNPKTYKLPPNAWDDSFSNVACLQPIKKKIIGKTWQQISNEFERCVGFVEGKNAEELGNGFVKLLNGGKAGTSSTGTGNQQGGGGNILELIKQVCSDWDPLGVEINLDGDTVGIRRTNPNTAVALGTNRIQRNSVNMVDYDSNTPNVNGTVKDNYLIKRFGEVPMDAEVDDANKAQVLQVAQRGHNHSIDLKCILGKEYNAGNWVKLTIPELGIENRPYYISKSGNQEERVTSLTLESAPPSRYVEVQEMAVEEEVSEDGTETEE